MTVIYFISTIINQAKMAREKVVMYQADKKEESSLVSVIKKKKKKKKKSRYHDTIDKTIGNVQGTDLLFSFGAASRK